MTRSADTKQLSRARGQSVVARALWYVKSGTAEIKPERLDLPGDGMARVETYFSLISRGTERLVFLGQVPDSEWQTMRAPLQAGDFPFPVKYGYSAAGRVTHGPDQLVGKTVFALAPHQDYFHAAEHMLHVVPDGIPARRAVLAANMETALNAHWDAGTSIGAKVLVIGAGIVGLLTAHLSKRTAGCEVVITDTDPAKAQYAQTLGIPFATSAALPKDNAIIFHTSATAAGLNTALEHAAGEARIVEMSWYGSKAVPVDLGRAFHSRRLQIISSQVGRVAPSMRGHVTPAQRLTKAIALLDDPALDCLVSEKIAFEDLPARLTQIFGPGTSGLAPVIDYGKG